MQTIVAATDFSENSVNAVYYAADMACVTGADLTLLHVYPLPEAFRESPVTAYNFEQVEKDALKDMDLLEETVNNRTGGRIKVSTALMQGKVVEGIKDYCETVELYAVVTGSESKGEFDRLLFGGNTLKAIKKLPWPVMVVPPGVKFTSLRNIGLACDFRDVVDTIPFREIQSLVNKFKAALHVIHVREEGDTALRIQETEEYLWLQNILSELNPQYHFINDTNIETGINRFLEKNELDLLIIIPKKHNLFHKLFYPSHSKNLVLQVQVPVMSVHE